MQRRRTSQQRRRARRRQPRNTQVTPSRCADTHQDPHMLTRQQAHPSGRTRDDVGDGGGNSTLPDGQHRHTRGHLTPLCRSEVARVVADRHRHRRLARHPRQRMCVAGLEPEPQRQCACRRHPRADHHDADHLPGKIPAPMCEQSCSADQSAYDQHDRHRPRRPVQPEQRDKPHPERGRDES